MYSIKVTPNYYQGTCNAPQESYLTYRGLEDDPNNGTDDIAEWQTKKEAQSVIDKLQGDGPYYLSHGEAGRPTYTIIEDFDNGLDDCQEASGYEMDGWMEVTPEDLPEGIRSKLDHLNVEHHTSGDDYAVYTDTYTEGGQQYAIVYLPRTTALQINAEDLGGLNWEKAAYFVED